MSVLASLTRVSLRSRFRCLPLSNATVCRAPSLCLFVLVVLAVVRLVGRKEIGKPLQISVGPARPSHGNDDHSFSSLALMN